MTLIFIILLLVVFFGVFIYRRPTFEKKLLKKIPIIDWINAIVLPIIMLLLFDVMILIMLQRGRENILDVEDFTLFTFFVCALIFTYIGNTIHFCGKALSRYIPKNKHDIVYQVNELFHQELSHYMSFMGGLITLFALAIIEVNYPLSFEMTRLQHTFIISVGILTGIAATKAVFIWETATYRPISWLNFILFMSLILIDHTHKLTLSKYQYYSFMMSFMAAMIVMFALKTIIVLKKLNTQGRVRYLIKLLSLE